MFAHGLWQHVVIVGLLMGLIPLGLGLWGEATDRPWQTMVFTTLTLSQMGNALAVRSERDSLFRIGLFSNKPLLGAVLLTFVLQLAVVYVPFLQVFLSTQALTLNELLICILVSGLVLFETEIEKTISRYSRIKF